MSNIDPTHAIPLLIAGALQSGLAFVFMPTTTGFAILATEPESMTDDEIEQGSEVSAIAVVDLASASTLEVSYQLGVAVKRLADYIVSGDASDVDQYLMTPAEQARFAELRMGTPFEDEVVMQAVLAEREPGNSAVDILNTIAQQGLSHWRIEPLVTIGETGAND